MQSTTRKVAGYLGLIVLKIQELSNKKFDNEYAVLMETH